MNFVSRIKDLITIIENNIDFVSQDDMSVLKSFDQRFKHIWYDEYMNLSKSEKVLFDAKRESHLIQDVSWLKLNKEISELCSFKKIETKKYDRQLLGKKKKQHEYGQLLYLLEPHKNDLFADFGGGVGNLSFFLNSELGSQACVFDKDLELLKIGRDKARKLNNSEITFSHFSIGEKDVNQEKLKKIDFGVGLHCCGNFGSNLARLAVKEELKNFLLFSCCYSKISFDDYKMSSCNIKTKLNTRALSSATLSFEKVDEEIFNFRTKIMDYKYSFYHLMVNFFGLNEFFPMSNSRKTVYTKTFYEFYVLNTSKFCPSLRQLSEMEVMDFYQSSENRSMIEYFNCYYAFSRYIGQAIESYIVLDRALFLMENDYKVEIYDAFDPKVSPRNKGIFASKNP